MPYVQVGDEAPLDAASEMLGCNKHSLRNALLTRNLAAGGECESQGGSRRLRSSGEMLTVPLDGSQAKRTRDKLIHEVDAIRPVREKSVSEAGSGWCLPKCII